MRCAWHSDRLGAVDVFVPALAAILRNDEQKTAPGRGVDGGRGVEVLDPRHRPPPPGVETGRGEGVDLIF